MQRFLRNLQTDKENFRVSGIGNTEIVSKNEKWGMQKNMVLSGGES